MTKEEILEKICLIIVDIKNNSISIDAIKKTSISLIKDLSFDSLEMINFIVKLEDEFDIEKGSKNYTMYTTVI